MNRFLKKLLITGLAIMAFINTIPINAQSDDLKLRYDYAAGANFSGDPYDMDESFYKALPLGNGRIGAMVYGNYPDERIDLNECTFWSSGPGNNNKAGAVNYLQTAQDQLFAGRYLDGDATIGNMIGGGQARYQSIGYLNIALGHTPVSSYSRQLDMNTGIVSCDYTYNGKTYHRESFVSYPDQILVTRITSGSPGSISFTAAYGSSLSGQCTFSTSGSDTLIMDGHGDSDNGVTYAVWFSTRTKIIPVNGSLSVSGDGIRVTNADSVILLTSVRTNFVNYALCNGDEKGNAAADINEAAAKAYTTLYNNHIADYQELFHRVDVDMGGSGSENNKPMNQRISEFNSTNDPKLVKVLFQYGRYLMITASRDAQPMNLQGIWSKFRYPAWGCKMTTNINYEMNYWPAFTTNLEECFEAFVNKAKALQSPGNETARVHYNISNGWVLHHNTDLWNRCAPIDGVWGFWPTGAGWICNMLYDAYTFNQDTGYLDEVYPVIKGAADFLQTLMRSHTINGQTYQVICPGTSPEVQTPSGSGGQGAWCSPGVTMDNGICRELFRGVIRASEILNVDASFRSTLQSKLSQIKPDTVGSWGQLQEWAYDWDSQSERNRHISQVYSLFPGQEISKRNTSALANAAIVSLNARGDAGTGWSEGWKLNCWARLEDGPHAYNLIKLMITPVNQDGRLYDNLWDAHPPFQIDGNFGFTSGIAEMLLQSHNNEIQFLPALPDEWPAGHANGLRARGNFTITEMTWTNRALESVTIRSNSGNVCNVRYGTSTNSFSTIAGGTYELNGSLQVVNSGTPAPTAVPTPAPTANQEPIFSGGPYTLNGTSDYVDLPDGLTDDLYDFSIACRVNLNSLDTWTRIFDFGGDTDVFMMFTPASGNTGYPYFCITLTGNDGEQGLNGTGALPTGSWQHIAVTRSGTTGILYINGQEVDRNTNMTIHPADMGNTTNNFIGRSQWEQDPFLNGEVDEFYIYNRAINASEVADLADSVEVTPDPTPAGTLGDVDSDDDIDIVDALLIAQYYVELDPDGFIPENADTNCDGSINIVDALLVAQYYVELIQGFCL
jgi:alpha-L-fucosidase 2